jgi:putative oxidoreductase
LLGDVMLNHSDVLILAARVLLMALFVVTGYAKLTNFSRTTAYMASTGLPMPQVAAMLAVAIELFGGLALAIGVFTRPLALLYVVFTFVSALEGHRFWKRTGPEREAQKINFLKNVSIMGGLLLLAITGPGKFALGGPLDFSR